MRRCVNITSAQLTAKPRSVHQENARMKATRTATVTTAAVQTTTGHAATTPAVDHHTITIAAAQTTTVVDTCTIIAAHRTANDAKKNFLARSISRSFSIYVVELKALLRLPIFHLEIKIIAD